MINFLKSLKKLGWKKLLLILAAVSIEILLLFFVLPAFSAEAAINERGDFDLGTANPPPITMAEGTPILQKIYEVFDKEQSRWLIRMGNLLWWSFCALMSISLLLQLYKLGLSDSISFGSIMHLLVKFILYAGFYKFVFGVFTVTPYGDEVNLLTLIPDTFVWLAEKVTGYQTSVFQLITIAGNMVKSLFGITSKFGVLQNLFACIPIFFLNIIFYMIAGQMIMAKIEVVMITLAGLSLLVFDGFMNVFDYGKRYLNALIACGFKLFMLSIICGMLQRFATEIPGYFSEEFGGFFYGSAIALGVVVVMYLIAKNVPTMVAATLSGSMASPDRGFYSSLSNGIMATVGTAMAGYGMAQAGVQATKAVANATQGYFGQPPLSSRMSAADEPPVSYDDGSKG